MTDDPFMRLGLSVEQVLTGVDISLLSDLKIKIIHNFNYIDTCTHTATFICYLCKKCGRRKKVPLCKFAHNNYTWIR